MGADQRLTRLFYDGNCALCRGAVRFVTRRDHSGGIRFAPLGGRSFEGLVAPEVRRTLPDSLLVLTPQGDLLIRSRAVIHLLRRMGPVWRLVGALLAWLPVSLCDWAYTLVARRRPTACGMENHPQDRRFEP